MEICDTFSFAFLPCVRDSDNRMYLYLVYIIIDKLTLLPMEPEIKTKVVIDTKLTYYEFLFST